jgi:hypothetical protein
VTALGRTLAAFYTQDDDPTVNGSADTNFLASLIKSHIDAIRTAVLAAYSGAKFELLWPFDVNFARCYYTPDVPYPQGGRLNRAVNLPSQSGADWLGPRPSQDGSAVVGSDVPELHEPAGRDCIPRHHARQLAGLRDRLPGPVVQRRLPVGERTPSGI